MLLQPWIRIEAPQQDEIQPYVQADDSAAVRSAAPQLRGCCAAAWQRSAVSGGVRHGRRMAVALGQVAIVLKYNGHHIPSQVRFGTVQQFSTDCVACALPIGARGNQAEPYSSTPPQHVCDAWSRLLLCCFARALAYVRRGGYAV